MKISAAPIGPRYGVGNESDVVELTYAEAILRVAISTESADGRDLMLGIEFRGPRGFRLLDEGDLIRYWEAKVFAPGYHLFEITAGGWCDQETQLPGMLSVSSAIGVREWFVATTNTCINVLSAAAPPVIRERTGPFPTPRTEIQS